MTEITTEQTNNTQNFTKICDRQCKRCIFMCRELVQIIFAIHSNVNQRELTTPYYKNPNMHKFVKWQHTATKITK